MNAAPAEVIPLPWPEPVNMLQELSAPAFTGDELPAELAAYPLAYAAATGFDASLTLTAAVAVAAAAISDAFQIVGDSASKWFQQPRLWLLSIGRPGAGKTPAQRAMLEPLWTIQKAQRSAHQKLLADLPEGETPPPTPRIILADTTIEALSEALRDNPRGLLIANDEFESWLGSLDAYRRGGVSRDRGEWLRVFDGGPHTIERVQRGSVYVENWGASILTATTPAALAKVTRALPEDGLLQRFIPVICRSKGEPRHVPTLEAARERYTQMIGRLFDATPRAHDGCVPLSLDAQQFLKVWLRQNQLQQEAVGSLEPGLEAHVAKYPTLLLRLTLTFHAATTATQESPQARDPAAWPVTLLTIETAARFLRRAALHSMALYLNRRGSEAFDVARDTARAILARGWTVVTRRELMRGVQSFRKADDTQATVLRLLVDLGWLRYGEGGYLKSIPTRYDVNPLLRERFASIAERERERRATVRELIAEGAALRRSGDE